MNNRHHAELWPLMQEYNKFKPSFRPMVLWCNFILCNFNTNTGVKLLKLMINSCTSWCSSASDGAFGVLILKMQTTYWNRSRFCCKKLFPPSILLYLSVHRRLWTDDEVRQWKVKWGEERKHLVVRKEERKTHGWAGMVWIVYLSMDGFVWN